MIEITREPAETLKAITTNCMTIMGLAKKREMLPAAIQQHLLVLCHAGLVVSKETSRRGRTHIYIPTGRRFKVGKKATNTKVKVDSAIRFQAMNVVAKFPAPSGHIPQVARFPSWSRVAI